MEHTCGVLLCMFGHFRWSYLNTVGQKALNFRDSRKKKRKSMTRGLQMCAFLRWFMELSEGMQGDPDPLSPLEQPCLVFPQWKPFPG